MSEIRAYWKIFAATIFASALALPVNANGVLPPAMIGTWGWDAGSCAKPDDDGHAIVGERSVDFAASSYQLETIVRKAETIRATATVHEEGEPETSTGIIELKLVAPDRLSVSNGPDLTHTYVRCRPGVTPHGG